jgi:KUP system potassium uptake protein
MLAQGAVLVSKAFTIAPKIRSCHAWELVGEAASLAYERGDSMLKHTAESPHPHMAQPNIPALSLAALGVVFGDIGTSPLYTFKTVLDVAGHSEPAAILGALSLILWTLIIVTSLKYVTIALRVDNNGEGGILALMTLLRRMEGRWQIFIMLLGLCGAALVYGDAAITPAISVLSALEGLDIVAPQLQRYVLPATAGSRRAVRGAGAGH